MEKEEILDLLDRYFSDTVPADQKNELERRIGEDIEMAQLVKDYLAARAIIEGASRDEVRTKVNERFRELNQRKIQRLTPIRFLMMAAATLLVLFAVTRLLKVSDSLSGDELFDEYFALPEVSAVRSGYLTDDQWSTALAYLQSGNYSFALALLVPFQQDESVVRREEALLYSGICHIQLDQYREAIESFASISIDSSLAKEGQWYTALAYLKLGSKEETKRILKSIISSTWHPKMKETETLLKKL